MSSRAEVLATRDYETFVARIRAGENVGGVFWLGTPAEMPPGRQREGTCMYSELILFGEAWVHASRCPKQIAVSCDECFRYTDVPFYEEGN